MTDPSQGPYYPTIPGLPTRSVLVIDPDVGATVKTASTQADKLRQVYVDNRKNSTDVWLKIYDALIANVTVGTTVPPVYARVEARDELHFVSPGGISFATGISFAVVTEGGSDGNTSPTNTVGVLLEVVDFA